jgi:amidohydrolase
MAADLPAEVQSALPVVNEAYRFLHANPELGKAEHKAHGYLRRRLADMGYTQFVESKRAPTAVIAVLDTGRPGPVVALRAEMDARPLPTGQDEPAAHTPRSSVAGVMHTCGHDVHAAILLGAAQVLIRNTDKLQGKVVILFQPAEETAGGADDIVAEGLLDRLGVQRIFAEHAAPGMPVGTVAVSPGPTLAGSNYFSLKLSGRSAHAAAPSDGDDVLLAAARIVEALSYAPARRIDLAQRPMVVSITSFTADGGARNVLPSQAEAQGTLRAFEDPKAAPPGLPSIETILTREVDGLAKAYGLTYQWDLATGSPPTVNDPKLFESVIRPLTAAFPGTVDTAPHRGMFSEDFAHYTAQRQALYFSLGIAKDGLGGGGVHTAEFTVHPDAFAYGLTLMCLLAEIGVTGRSDWAAPSP